MIILFLTYILNIADYLFTLHWVNSYGIEIEANPIGRWLFENDLGGFVKIFVVGGLFLLLGYLLKLRPKAKKVVYLLFGVYSAVVIYHTVLAFQIV
ncbi:MAG: hypothetical protein J6K88_01670 [Oscillospiraceae bacterium]|nr:hypothetical protein [Oscillospiraceae bacterium]